MRKITLFQILVLFSISIVAEIPSGYYSGAVGKTEAALKTQLYTIISHAYNSASSPVDMGYGGLYTIYRTSDLTSTGNVWDMYSTCTWTHGEKQCGSYSNVCDCYNREHSVPQSWFNKAYPMRSDAFHVYPTDGKVNGLRSNYPYGECNNGTGLNKGKGKLGSSTLPDYSGIVFEPDNEYKGDFARTYFYFATRYQNIMTTIGGESFDNTTYPSLSGWSIALFLKWTRQDPVSQKELTRNEAIYAYQKNRNPFIDHPELAEYIWGDKKGSPWSLNAGIDELKIEFSISQVSGSKILKINTNLESINYRIVSLNGISLINKTLDDSKEINIAQLKDGMYFVEIFAGNRRIVKKFVVNN